MPRVNKTRYAILGVLNMGPKSGYDIKKFCDKGIAHFWHENYGHIYPVLKQMEQDGLVAKNTEYNDGKPARYVYSITQQGKEAMLAWLEQPVQPAPARLELLLKLTFADNLPPTSVIRELEECRKRHESRLQEYLEIEKTLLAAQETHKAAGFPYWFATLRYGIYDSRFRIAWCTETVDNIKQHFHIQ